MTLPQDQSIYSDEEFFQDLAEFAVRNQDLGSNHKVKEVLEEAEESPEIPSIQTLLESINAKRQEAVQEPFERIEDAIESMKNPILEDIREIGRQLEAAMSSNFKLKCALGFVSTLLCMSALYILYREFPVKLDLQALLTWSAKLPNNIGCDNAEFMARD